LAAAESFRDFFNHVFEVPLVRNAQKRDKNKPSKTTEGGKKTEGKKATFFVMNPNPGWTFFFGGGLFFSMLLNSPCYKTQNAQKRDTKKIKGNFN
jgi:hypothetical protein